MKKYFIFITLVFFQTVSCAETLEVSVSGIVPNNGKIRIAIFDSESGFQNEKYIKGQILDSTKNHIKATFYNLMTGKYAVAVYQDTNENTEVDKNFFGYPTELLGFSGKKTFGKPKFEDASFLFNANNKEISIRIQ